MRNRFLIQCRQVRGEVKSPWATWQRYRTARARADAFKCLQSKAQRELVLNDWEWRIPTPPKETEEA